MSLTGRDLLSASLRLLGVLASGESMEAQEATDGLASINRMLASWSNEGLMIFAETQESPITLSSGVATVTMGAGGTVTTRPQEIIRAVLRAGQTDYAMRILTLDEYARIPVKSTQSSIPYWLYDDGGYPQRTLTLYPVPSTGNQLILWTKEQLSTIATLDTVLSFPPGYEEAIIYNGAIRLAPEYGKTVTPEIADVARASKAAIKRLNSREQLLRVDSALVGPGRFNILTGEYYP